MYIQELRISCARRGRCSMMILWRFILGPNREAVRHVLSHFSCPVRFPGQSVHTANRKDDKEILAAAIGSVAGAHCELLATGGWIVFESLLACLGSWNLPRGWPADCWAP